jgi:hypothetical protein
LDGEASRENRPENVVVHHEEMKSGSFRVFKDGSIEIESAGEKRWYRDFAELERSRLSSPGVQSGENVPSQQGAPEETCTEDGDLRPIGST